MSSPRSTGELSPLRSFLWPIYGYEMKKFFPTAGMMFLIIFNYTIMRNTKDAMVVPIVGPEVIPFLKGMILPLSIGLVLLYTWLANRLTQSQVFYAGISLFMSAFIVFYFFLFPYRDVLLPSHDKIDALQMAYPLFHHIFSIYKVWVYVFFYVFAELWGAISLQFLFWQFANDITRIDEAKRFYPMYAFIGHLSLVMAGWVGLASCHLQQLFGSETGDGCDIILDVVTGAFLLGAILIICIRSWLGRHVLTNPFYYDAAASTASQKKKIRLSFWESIQQVFSSPYLGMIVILVLGYGISNNILGLLWKKQLQIAYPIRQDYHHFMNLFSVYTGFSTIILIFIFKGVIPRFGWYTAAMVTPVVLFVTGAFFFSCMFYEQFMTPVLAYIGFTPVYLAVGIGTFQQIVSKSAKYAMFDPTKEMAYIPLDDFLKTRGKAAADIIGHTLSKASGGYIIAIVLMVTYTKDLMDIAPILSWVVMAVITGWIFTVHGLNKRYTALLQKRQEDRTNMAKAQSAIKKS